MSSRSLSSVIAESLDLSTPRDFPALVLYRARSDSNLSRFTGTGEPPYWAYSWAGGNALAKFLIEHPRLVAGRRVVDYGAGSGIAGIVAAIHGAASVRFVECSAAGRAVIGLNAAANGVAAAGIFETWDDALLAQSDLIVAGDVFYDSEAARTSMKLIGAARRHGVTTLTGDPGRRNFPDAGWPVLGTYQVHDFGLSYAVEACVYDAAGRGASDILR